jgi:hypothetical protein
MRLDEMPYHSKPTLAVFPFRQFQIGWTWQLQALKFFPDFQLAWKRHFFDNGDGRARGAVFTTFEEAMVAADAFNQTSNARVTEAVYDPSYQASTLLKVEKTLTAVRRIHDEEELMEREAIRRHARQPRPAIHELELSGIANSLREQLHEQLERAPYLQLVALRRYNVCLSRTDDSKWVSVGALNSRASKTCHRELTARGFGLSGGDHWGRTKAQIRALLLPRANQLLQLASVKQMLAEARRRGQRVLVCSGFVFWYEDDGVPGWIVKNTGGESNSEDGLTIWHEGTILSKNHGRIVVLPYIKENGERVQGHTKSAPYDGRALPRHRHQYVTLPFEVLKGDLMIGLFGELYYE